MAEKSKSSSKPIVDVAHPNKSAPSQNSKSVIVSNRPMLKDPMVVDQEDQEITTIEEKKPESTITEIAAIAAADKPAEEEERPADKDDKPEPAKEESKPEPAKEAEPNDSAPEEPKADEADTKEQDKDTAPENQLDIDASKEAEHEAAIQKLSESKKYFLPINAVEQRKSKQFVILGIVLSVILALAWVDIALDASLIKIPGVKPVTHLFSN
jgi:archaellum component FlaD/FlaE